MKARAPWQPLPLSKEAREARVAELRTLLAEYFAGRPLSAAPTRRVMCALDAWLRTGADFTQLMGLKPPSGKKNLAHWRIAARLDARCVSVYHASAAVQSPAQDECTPFSEYFGRPAPSEAPPE